MPLILAIEPDRRQAAKIAALARGPLNVELLVTESTERAIAALGERVPDLILTSLLLSPKDEMALADRLRELDAVGAHVQTLTIPVLGAPTRRSRASGGLLTRLRRPQAKDASPDGCDPAVFGAQIAEYLERVAAERAILAASREYAETTTAIHAEPPSTEAIPPIEIQTPADLIEAAADLVEASANLIDAPAANLVEVSAELAEVPADLVEAQNDGIEASAGLIEAPAADLVEVSADLAEVPADLIAAPNDVIEASAGLIEAHAADLVEVSADLAEVPADLVAAPNDVIEASADLIEAPVNLVETSVDLSDAFADLVEVSAAFVEAPADLVQTPIALGDAPADLVEASADFIEAPADFIGAPADEGEPARQKARQEGLEADDAASLVELVAEDVAATSEPSFVIDLEPIDLTAFVAELEATAVTPAFEIRRADPVMTEPNRELTAEPVADREALVEGETVVDQVAAIADSELRTTLPFAAQGARPPLDGVSSEEPVLQDNQAWQEAATEVELTRAGQPHISDAAPATNGELWAAPPVAQRHSRPHLEGVPTEPPRSVVPVPERPPAVAAPRPATNSELWTAPPIAQRHNRPRLEGVPTDPVRSVVPAPVRPHAVATPSPEPTQPPAQPEWLEMLTAIRNDIERLRADRAEAPAPSPIAAEPAAPVEVPLAAASAPPIPTAERPRKKKRPKAPAPMQDEWGFFDPEQCGFAALLAKLEEVTEGDEAAVKRPG